MPIWIRPRRTGVSGDRRAEGLIAEHTEELSRKQQFDINNDETNFGENFTSSNVRMFPGAKGVPKRKRVTSGAMHRARKAEAV